MALLLYGSPRSSLADAAAMMEELLADRPDDPSLWIDLAAIWLTDGWSTGDLESFARALRAADRARRIRPDDPRACFNRAHALEALALLEGAAEAWRECAGLGSAWGWRSESLSHREKLLAAQGSSAHVPREDLLRALREHDLERLREIGADDAWTAIEVVLRHYAANLDLPSWRHDAGAVAGFRELASSVAERTGDRLLQDLVSGLEALREDEQPGVARGLDLLAEGLEHYESGAYRRARRALVKAAGRLESLSSVQAVSRVHAAGADLDAHASRAETELERLLADLAGRDYLWASGYAHWLLGVLALRGKAPLSALSHYGEALVAYGRLGNRQRVAIGKALLAETYAELGRTDAAWRLSTEAIREAYAVGAPEPIFRTLDYFVGIAQGLGFPELALYAQSSALAREAPARSRAISLVWRSLLASSIGRYQEALADLEEVQSLLPSIVDPGERAAVQVELALGRGTVLAELAPAEAVAELDRAVDGLRPVNLLNTVIALETRAAALRRLGRPEAALRDLLEALRSYESALADPATSVGSDREVGGLSYVGRHGDVYRSLVDLYLVDLGEPWKAFGVAERAKALAAPGELGVGFADVESPQERLVVAPGTALLSYGVLRGRIAAWVITAQSRDSVILCGLDEIERLLGELNRAGTLASWRATAAALHQRLVSPVAHLLTEASTLVVVPTAGLDRIPFGGLVDGSGRFLIERFVLRLLPAATWMTRGERDLATRGMAGRALFVGDPAASAAATLGLPRLPFARREVEVAAERWGVADLLLGERATLENVLERLRSAELAHFSTHAIVYSDPRPSAALLLADGARGEPGLLRSEQIARLRLPQMRLVVLSACSSAGGSIISWQSGLTLARSFLGAGARGVVATLAVVDDQETAALFGSFYEALARGEQPIAALHRAQREQLTAIEAGGRPSWPYVVYIG